MWKPQRLADFRPTGGYPGQEQARLQESRHIENRRAMATADVVGRLSTAYDERRASLAASKR